MEALYMYEMISWVPYLPALSTSQRRTTECTPILTFKKKNKKNKYIYEHIFCQSQDSISVFVTNVDVTKITALNLSAHAHTA